MHLKEQDDLCTGFIWLGIETRVVNTATNLEVALRTEWEVRGATSNHQFLCAMV
jgi:hypothetical protein